MSYNNYFDYQDAFNRMVDPQLWGEDQPSVQSPENQNVVQHRLSQIAVEYFGQSEAQQTPSDTLTKFLARGVQSSWLSHEQMEKFDQLVRNAGLIKERKVSLIKPWAKGSSDPLTPLIEKGLKTTFSKSGARVQAPLNRMEEVIKEFIENSNKQLQSTARKSHSKKLKTLQEFHPNLAHFMKAGLSKHSPELALNEVEKLFKYMDRQLVNNGLAKRAQSGQIHIVNRRIEEQYIKMLAMCQQLSETVYDAIIDVEISVAINNPDAQKRLILKAIKSNQLNLLEKLLESANIDVNMSLNEKGDTPLIAAVENHFLMGVDLLLAHGADVEKKNNDGFGPLAFAAYFGADSQIAKRLIAAGADVNSQSNNGLAPLHFAAIVGNTTLIKLLIEHHADVNLKSKTMRTPLYQAVSKSHLEAIQFLIDAGATDSLIDSKTNLQHALEKKLPFKNDMKAIFAKTDSLPLTLELKHRSLLTHVAEIDLPETLIDRKGIQRFEHAIDSTGSFSPFMFSNIRKSFAEFSSEFSLLASNDLSAMVNKAFAINIAPRFLDPEELYTKWKNGEPIILPTGYSDHAVTITMWNDKLIICNRGEMNLHPLDATYEVFTMDPTKMNTDIMLKILDSNLDKDAYKDWHATLIEDLDLTTGELESALESYSLPEQTIGNCAWASAEGALFMVMVLKNLYECFPHIESLPISVIRRVTKEQKKAFAHWQAFVLIRTMKKYLAWIDHPDNHFIPNINLIEHAFKKLKAECVDLNPRLASEWNELHKEWKTKKLALIAAIPHGRQIYHFGFKRSARSAFYSMTGF